MGSVGQGTIKGFGKIFTSRRNVDGFTLRVSQADTRNCRIRLHYLPDFIPEPFFAGNRWQSPGQGRKQAPGMIQLGSHGLPFPQLHGYGVYQQHANPENPKKG
jgi:hypothetical protein